mmetsp:Transcript_33918/g.59128  ORF Transcript_33918/g.59128 Transcript_33918/m.59128 type:complete len:117 (+) Transcript_33918:784-1134(+)
MGCYSFKQQDAVASICCYRQHGTELVLQDSPTTEFNDISLTSSAAYPQQLQRSPKAMADLESAFISTSTTDFSLLNASTPKFRGRGIKQSFGSSESCSIRLSPILRSQERLGLSLD